MRSESKNALSAVLSTEGRVGGPYWEKLNLKDLKPPKAPRTLNQKSFLEDFVNFWR